MTLRERVKDTLGKILLVAASITICYAVAEFAFFRFVLPYMPLNILPHLPDRAAAALASGTLDRPGLHPDRRAGGRPRLDRGKDPDGGIRGLLRSRRAAHVHLDEDADAASLKPRRNAMPSAASPV